MPRMVCKKDFDDGICDVSDGGVEGCRGAQEDVDEFDESELATSSCCGLFDNELCRGGKPMVDIDQDPECSLAMFKWRE